MKLQTVISANKLDLLAIGFGIVLGSAGVFFLGVTNGADLPVWGILVAVALLLLGFVVARRRLTRLTSWLRAGTTFLLAALAGAVLFGAAITAWSWWALDTQYAPGYSERAFNTVKIGDTYETVVARLGEPLARQDAEPFQEWLFSPTPQPQFAEAGSAKGTYTIVRFDASGQVANVFGQTQASAGQIWVGDGNDYLGLSGRARTDLIGLTQDEIRRRFGAPTAVYASQVAQVLVYSRSPSSSHYRLRDLGLDADGRVVRIWKAIYWD